MTLNEFISYNQLRPADAVMLNKKIFGMLDHYVIYLGIVQGGHMFIANYNKGVQIVSENDLKQFLKILVPRQIHRFKGDIVQRQEAVQRGLKRLGEKEYDLFNNNCEHFKNDIQYGVSKSHQVDSFKNGIVTVAFVGIGIGILSSLLGNGKK